MHKWSGRVEALARMVETADVLPLHRPLHQWSEEAWDRLGDPAVLALLSDATLERIIAELEAIVGDEVDELAAPAPISTAGAEAHTHDRPPMSATCGCSVCEDHRKSRGSPKQ